MSEELKEVDLSEFISIANNGERHFTPEFAAALAEFQFELPSAKKDKAGYGYKYSDLGTVIDTARPVLHKHGFSITQLIQSEDASFVKIETILLHKSTGRISSIATLPTIVMKGCNAAQGAGASLSYLRRYAYQAIIGMASEDNDASSKGFDKKETKKPETKTVSTKTNSSWS